MRLVCTFPALLSLLISLLSIRASSQELSAQPGSGAKVCVALVNNHSAELLDQDRMTARLVRAIAEKKLTVEAMDSSTGNSRDLRPTLENSQEMKSKDCDYMVLTMITGSSSQKSPGDSEVTIGRARVPSVDASDPMGGQSGPVYRNELSINFAVFRPGNLKPVIDTRILDRTRANASDSLMDAMDREGNRIKHELSKK